MTPHSATRKCPFFVLHGMDTVFLSNIVPNGSFIEVYHR